MKRKFCMMLQQTFNHNTSQLSRWLLNWNFLNINYKLQISSTIVTFSIKFCFKIHVLFTTDVIGRCQCSRKSFSGLFSICTTKYYKIKRVSQCSSGISGSHSAVHLLRAHIIRYFRRSLVYDNSPTSRSLAAWPRTGRAIPASARGPRPATSPRRAGHRPGRFSTHLALRTGLDTWCILDWTGAPLEHSSGRYPVVRD